MSGAYTLVERTEYVVEWVSVWGEKTEHVFPNDDSRQDWLESRWRNPTRNPSDYFVRFERVHHEWRGMV